ncbi:hypothetical protein JL722_820 [Aureococcus anophagefferens]|nr:hypothetical protein JL722_820 [Aureococcus anophagefferens]
MGAAGGHAGAPLLALLCACALRCADAKTWSAAPTGLAFPNATGVWEDVAGLAVTVRGGAGARLLLSHTLSVYAAYDSPDASYVAEGSLQVRFVVDGAPLRAGATLLDANLHGEARVKAEAALGRAVVTLNDDRAKVVKVQWKAAGAAAWRSDPSLKEGFSSGRVLTATAHEALHAAEPLSAAALSRSDWVAVKDTAATFDLPYATDARLTVDGQSYRETVAAASSRDRYASAAATLAREVLVRLSPASTPSPSNGVDDRFTEATTEDWATVETASFDVPAEGVVVVEYALPVTLHGRPDFDSWTFASLQTVEARVLLDGVPYREDGSMVGTSVARTFDELRGQLAAPLAPGSHTATLQWRANRPEAWQLVSGRYGGLEESLVTILLDFDQLLSDVEYRPDANYHGDDVLVVLLASTTETNATDLLRIPVAVAAVNDGAVLQTPSALSVTEGGRVSLGGVSFADVDSASDPHLEYKLTFLALGGAFLPCDGDDTAPFLEVAGTAADVNDCVAAMYYEPYEGFRGAYVENITVTLDDASGGSSATTIPVTVDAGKRAPQVVAPPYYELALGGLVVDGSDAGELVTVALRTDAADALLSLGDGFERSGVSNVSYAEDAITLTGSPANLTAALANLGYVREPSFEGSDTITATVTGADGEERRTSISLDLRSGDDAGALDILGFPRPRRGPATGGTRVLLDVAGAGAAPLSCQFGNATVPAELLYNDTYACDAPEASRAGYAALRVTDGGFWSDERQFLYEAPLVVSSLSPPVGPRSGGTTILVLLEEPGCVPSDALACVVGGTPTPATYVNATAVSCVAPPSDVEGAAGVAVTTNGVDVSATTRSFEYTRPLADLVLRPAFGPVAGGTRVEVSSPGGGFDVGLPYLCRFGLDAAPAAVYDAATLVCYAPARSAETNDTVTVSGDGGNSFSGTGAVFGFVDARLAAAAPSSGPPAGGTVVVVSGAGFMALSRYGAVRCAFGDALADAVVVNDVVLKCVAPAAPRGAVGLKLSVGGRDPASSGRALTYVYEDDALLSALEPASGPAAGGTVVAVSGLNIPDSTDLRCRFGALDVDARWVSSTEAECVAPAAAAPGAVAVRLGVADQQMSADALEFVYAAALDLAAASPLSGPANGGTVVAIEGSGFRFSTLLHCRFGWTEVAATFDYVDLASSFVYEVSPVVASIAPDVGAVAGGTAVTILGSGFEDVTLCLFGDEAIPATVASATEVRCAAPAAAAGAVAVGVSINGADAYAGTSQYRYVAVPEVLSLEPASGGVAGGGTVILECEAPAGAAGDVAVEVSVNGADFTDDGATFSYLATAVVSGVSPASGPSTGGTEVTDWGASSASFAYLAGDVAYAVTPASGPAAGGTEVTVGGADFQFTAELACRFSNDETYLVMAAAFVDASTIRCVAPTWAGRETVVLALSSNGVDFTDVGAFAFEAPATLDGIAPTMGSIAGGTAVELRGAVDFVYLDDLAATAVEPASASVAGGVEVTVTGDGFAYPSRSCRFGDAVVAARFVSPTELACVAPAHDAGAVVLALSGNGLDFVDVAEFAFWPEAVVLGAARVRRRLGGTVVALAGANFPVDAGDVACLFGDVPAAAVGVVSASEVRCESPAAAAGTAKLSLSFNGAEARAGVDLTYRYVAGVLLGQLEPASGPAAGGTVVAVSGLNIPDSTDLRCRFGALDVDARWVSSTEAECVAPAAAAPGAVAVRLGVADQQMSADALEFVYAAALDLAAASPLSGPANGGTVVAIEGSGFRFSTLLYCRFGWTEVAATFVSETEIRCASPSGESGPATLSVSNNKQDYVDLASSFVYEVSPVVASIAPDVGAVAGGTAVTILGSGFEDVTLCLFGDEAIPATVASATEVRCAAPAAAAGAVAVGVSINGADAYAGTSQYRYVAVPEVLSLEPASGGVAGGGTVIVRGLNFADSSLLACRFGTATRAVSVNGADFTDDGATFSYLATAVVSGVSPASGPSTGGTEVTVTGSDLAFSTTLACRFAFVDVAASFVSSSELRCVAPAHGAGSVSFAVVDDGRVLYGASDAFEYKPLMVVVSATLLRCVAPAHAEGSVAVRVGAAGDAAVGAASDATYGRRGAGGDLGAPGARSGGEPITVYGSNFVDASELSCRFGGSALSDARWVSATELVCASPAGAGTVRVEVTVNGQDWGASSASFAYLAGDVTYAVTPASGPAAGGAELAIAASSPAAFDGADARCRFGVVDVAATAATAPSPASPRPSTPGPTPAAVDAASKACAAPPHLAGDVRLSVAPCALGATAATTSSTATYVYHEPVEVFNVFPRVFSASTRGEILVVGAHFVDSPALACSVYGAAQAARFISSSRLACSPPPVKDRAYVASMAAGLANTGVGAVRASNNGFDYSASSSGVKVARTSC